MLADTSTPFDLRFRFFGFPCSVSVLFWVGALMLSGISPVGQEGLLLLVVWVVALFVSILVHELGHAVAARQFGSHVRDVRLTMFGGYCSYDRQPAARWKRIAISLAGPVAGFLLWGLLRGGDEAFELRLRAFRISPYLMVLVSFLLTINLYWGLFNLLPILPMDGGRVSEELCEGGRVPNPNVTARWIGIGTAVFLIAFGLMQRTGTAPQALLEIVPEWLHPGDLMMLWFGLFAFQNYQEIQALRAERGWGRGYGYANDEPWR